MQTICATYYLKSGHVIHDERILKPDCSGNVEFPDNVIRQQTNHLAMQMKNPTEATVKFGNISVRIEAIDAFSFYEKKEDFSMEFK